MEYLEKRLQPKDYEGIEHFSQFALKNAIFEFEHYNRLLKKSSEKKVNHFKKLFFIALQNYKKLKHTYFKEYKSDFKRFDEEIKREPGVIDLLSFVTELDDIPLPINDQYQHLLKDGKEAEYYQMKWDEIYGILKDRVGRKKHENYVALIEMKIDHHLISDTDAMYFLYEKLKNNEPLPKSSGNETKTIPDVSTVDEGSLEELIRKYGTDFTFFDTDELSGISKKLGTLAEIDYMIEYHQETIDCADNYMDKRVVEDAKEFLKDYKKMREEFISLYKKKKGYDKNIIKKKR